MSESVSSRTVGSRGGGGCKHCGVVYAVFDVFARIEGSVVNFLILCAFVGSHAGDSVSIFIYGVRSGKRSIKGFIPYHCQVKSSQVANPRNAFCIEQRTAAKPKEAQVRVFCLFLLLPRLAPVGLIARFNLSQIK